VELFRIKQKNRISYYYISVKLNLKKKKKEKTNTFNKFILLKDFGKTILPRKLPKNSIYKIHISKLIENDRLS